MTHAIVLADPMSLLISHNACYRRFVHTLTATRRGAS